MLKEVKIVRELGKVSVKDSLFKDNDSYKEMAYIPIKGVEDEKFSISFFSPLKLRASTKLGLDYKLPGSN